jgi:ribonuclease VapC
MSATSYLECSMIMDRLRDPARSASLEDLVDEVNIIVEPVTPTQARIARHAYRDYGKGSGHRANLNFGDCFSYAVARERREPLLFKDDDFIHTNLRSALDSR